MGSPAALRAQRSVDVAAPVTYIICAMMLPLPHPQLSFPIAFSEQFTGALDLFLSSRCFVGHELLSLKTLPTRSTTKKVAFSSFVKVEAKQWAVFSSSKLRAQEHRNSKEKKERSESSALRTCEKGTKKQFDRNSENKRP